MSSRSWEAVPPKAGTIATTNEVLGSGGYRNAYRALALGLEPLIKLGLKTLKAMCLKVVCNAGSRIWGIPFFVEWGSGERDEGISSRQTFASWLGRDHGSRKN